MVVKGGDWYRGSIYLTLGAAQVYSLDEASTTVGFRLALSLSDEILDILGEKFGEFDKDKMKPVKYK